ncbi:PFL_4703 family integrating conjugative element protein [Billgrantia montanilacus]|uniref:TIGR03746 family integrating conjugative element protein n=1 Tax=Billgrantia montanilacus TaxID=2282305 RepID=A0A368TQM1_9GAMM|nr:TIGR03746 family integrating conjugative element protein [Halomonas montanilacus]RCV86911.1 TIGR03746 family integrating conjugative element protein [Halomonas montanilacus]
MSRYRHALAGRDAHITTLRGIILVLVVICGGLWWGWKAAPENLTIHNPPDLRSGSTRAWWEVPPSSVYAFGFYVWQQIQRWPTNGEADYERNLYSLQHFLTPSCRIELERDYERRLSRNELSGRVRGIYEIPGRGYRPAAVEILSRDAWVVTLDLAIDEQYAGTPVRDVFIRYPLRVVRADVDPEHNPWGLQIDCFDGTPQRLEVPNQEGADV